MVEQWFRLTVAKRALHWGVHELDTEETKWMFSLIFTLTQFLRSFFVPWLLFGCVVVVVVNSDVGRPIRGLDPTSVHKSPSQPWEQLSTTSKPSIWISGGIYVLLKRPGSSMFRELVQFWAWDRSTVALR